MMAVRTASSSLLPRDPREQDRDQDERDAHERALVPPAVAAVEVRRSRTSWMSSMSMGRMVDSFVSIRPGG
jgi:hypothetical protein